MTNANDPLVTLSTRIPASVHKRLKKAALIDLEVDMQDAVTEAITEWLVRHGG